MIEIIGLEAQNCRRNETKQLIKMRVVIYLGKCYGECKSTVLKENAMVLTN